MSVNVKITPLFNVRSIQRALARVGKDIDNYFGKAVERSLLRVHSNTSPLVPVDTGALKSNVTKSIGSIYGQLEYTQPYAIFVHDGTYKMRARPFLQRGSDKSEQYIEQQFNEAGEKIVQDIARS